MEKKIYRSRKDKVMGGVIAGAIDYFGWIIDPNIARVLYALFTIMIHGGGIILYIIAWIVIPEEPIQ
jgi:phage shock protein C